MSAGGHDEVADKAVFAPSEASCQVRKTGAKSQFLRSFSNLPGKTAHDCTAAPFSFSCPHSDMMSVCTATPYAMKTINPLKTAKSLFCICNV
jgi:hypothetical protein